jgi:hypothetical protein
MHDAQYDMIHSVLLTVSTHISTQVHYCIVAFVFIFVPTLLCYTVSLLFARPPHRISGYYLAGCGVRVKWALIKVYAVGTYLDPLAMSAVTNSSPEMIQDALLNPVYPRTIRIVMARGLSIQKYMDGIVESLEPRMHGMDLDK